MYNGKYFYKHPSMLFIWFLVTFNLAIHECFFFRTAYHADCDCNLRYLMIGSRFLPFSFLKSDDIHDNCRLSKKNIHDNCENKLKMGTRDASSHSLFFLSVISTYCPTPTS